PPFPGHAGTELDFAQGEDASSAGGVPIRIQDADGCGRYVAVVIRGVTVGPSPEWLATRLRAVGARPINNVVDATNYVLFELNQPIHAFDLATLRGPAIVVRRARARERIRTLDQVDRALDPEILVIADRDRAIAVAGVMGGAETEVGEGTRDLLVEVAWFEPKRVRTGARILGLDTDASHRFQREMDREAIPAAAHRVVELILTVAGGRVEGPAGDAYARRWTPPVVGLRSKRVSHLLGVGIPEKEMCAHLEPLGLVVEGSGAACAVRIPSWRPDLTREVDLIEEIARRRGYGSFPDDVRPFRPGVTEDAPVPRAVDRIRRALVSQGFLEARTLAFVHEAEGAVAVRNPLSEEEGHLRRWLLPGLVHRVEHNFARRVRDLRLFEVATVFLPGEGERPGEALHLAAVWTGARTPPHWSEPHAEFDVWDLKGLVETLAPGVAGPEAQVRPLDPPGGYVFGGLPFEAEAFAVVTPEGEAVGAAGRIRRSAVDAPPWAAPVFGLEIAVRHLAPPARRVAPIPALPVVERDLAIVVPRETPAAAVEDAIRRAAPETLEALDLFDVYAGEKIAAGHRSLAFRLRFRAADRTLTDGEVDEAVNRVIRHLKEALDVSIRGT
ncbi:MAG: phenylalanine--tRNA ligase subunit beta, partial [Gemmatimonadota bacterium]